MGESVYDPNKYKSQETIVDQPTRFEIIIATGHNPSLLYYTDSFIRVPPDKAEKFSRAAFDHHPEFRKKYEAIKSKLSHEEIAAHAYSLWEERDQPHGSPQVDWFQAVSDLVYKNIPKLPEDGIVKLGRDMPEIGGWMALSEGLKQKVKWGFPIRETTISGAIKIANKQYGLV